MPQEIETEDPVATFADARAQLDASREILDVINNSRDDERPVFDTLLRAANRLCGASTAGLLLGRPDDKHLTLAALHHTDDTENDASADRIARANTPPMDMDPAVHISARAICEGSVVHIADLAETDSYKAGIPSFKIMVEEMGQRSTLSVPLMDATGPIGAINLHRKTAGLFSESEIALIKSFTTQAVIAIENVRQFREIQTRLERETASSEVLEIISRSRDDEDPVFDAILQSVSNLCKAQSASLFITNQRRTYNEVRRHFGRQLLVDVPEAMRWPLDSGQAHTEAVRIGEVVHIADLRDTELYAAGDPTRVHLVDHVGLSTTLAVPLILNGTAIGSITLHRLDEPCAYSENEISVVEGFAAQAVIAIENARQFREVQIRLERERASSEILETISQSRDDEGPVFEAILSKAADLCNAPIAGLVMVDDERKTYRLRASLGAKSEFVEAIENDPPALDPDRFAAARAIVEQRIVHVEDLTSPDLYGADDKHRVSTTQLEGIRTVLFVPLIGQQQSIGAIGLWRREVSLFSEDEIALIETFAAQAVIAIENVRQFREVQERLEREAATSEVLSIISQSRDDEGPVFDTILKKAAELCDANQASLQLANAERTQFGVAAYWGFEETAFQVGGSAPLDSGRPIPQVISTGCTMNITDLSVSDHYRQKDPIITHVVDIEGIRSWLIVPLIKDKEAIGAIALSRREVKSFNESEIALVETFAAQAVIAIGNVRQFREVQERLEREEASREVLGVISRSRDDERPVFDAILENASRLCKAPLAFLPMANAERTHVTVPAFRGVKPDFAKALDEFNEPLGDSGLVAVRAIAEARIIQSADLVNDPQFPASGRWRYELVETEGARSVLLVPMMQGNIAIGAIMLYRREIAPFSEDDVQLVKTFAEQAVIAIENVRQFREVQERLKREAATSEILSVISQNQEDEAQVFDIILEKSVILCQADQAVLILTNAERTSIHLAAHWGHSRTEFSIGRSWSLESTMSAAEAIRSREVLHIFDFAETERYKSREAEAVQMVENEGIRTRLVVPLLRDGIAIGAIATSRREVRAFAASEIKLVETFAAQAVIAIENVRQFKALEQLNAELGDRVEEQVGEIERMGRLKRFLPAAVADTVVSQGSDNLLKSHRALLGVLFCDIRGFTAFCETAEPEETIEVLQSYHEEMGALIAEHGAGVDTRAGDGIMVLFNDPLPCDDPAGDALRLGLAMRERMAELSKKWRRHGHRLGFGVGISLGYATVGMVGSAGRFDYTASGTAVNLAARLCDQAKDGEILLSPRAYTAVEDDFDAEPVGELSLKGIHAPVEVFRVRTED